jgi:hypothetical protein
MHKCRVHNVDYEDFCVLCSGPPHLHKKLKYFFWLALVTIIMVLVFFASMKLYVE